MRGWSEVQAGTVYTAADTTVSVGKAKKKKEQRNRFRLEVTELQNIKKSGSLFPNGCWKFPNWKATKCGERCSLTLRFDPSGFLCTVGVSTVTLGLCQPRWLEHQAGAGRRRAEPKLIAPNELKYQSDKQKPLRILVWLFPVWYVSSSLCHFSSANPSKNFTSPLLFDLTFTSFGRLAFQEEVGKCRPRRHN